MGTGNWFRDRRQELGKTQMQIAAASGVTIPTVIGWERFTSVPKMLLISRLAHAYETDLDTIIREIGETAKTILKMKLHGTAPGAAAGARREGPVARSPTTIEVSRNRRPNQTKKSSPSLVA